MCNVQQEVPRVAANSVANCREAKQRKCWVVEETGLIGTDNGSISFRALYLLLHRTAEQLNS